MPKVPKIMAFYLVSNEQTSQNAPSSAASGNSTRITIGFEVETEILFKDHLYITSIS
jgi:hypothetical protein